MSLDLLTTEDVAEARRELKEIKNSFYSKNKKANKDYKDPEDVEKALARLENIPVVKITLAFDPDPSFLGELVMEIRKIAKMTVVVDLNVDSNLIGGLTISYMGKYLDLSLRNKVDEISRF